ncbi:MAG: DUF58 domain-containing protein [Betaproteobacteria bacterium]|nr:DUF58 domain-containing protein [Betaproteobacteria bacterium]
MIGALRNYFAGWQPRARTSDGSAARLGLRRVYILPSRHGILLCGFFVLMLLGSINYNLSLGYALTFLLASMAVVSMVHAFRNLAGLTVRAGRAEAVFAGDTATFNVFLENETDQPKQSIAISREAEPVEYYDAPARAATPARLRIPARRRGHLKAGRFRVFTRFPLGLFYAWSNMDLDMYCVVYPKPEAARLPLPAAEPSPGEGIESGYGSDDFAGLRPYHAGDSLRHIAWKAVAREQDLLTKQFTGRAEAELWLDWDLLPGVDQETRLSRLARWVLDAEARGLNYGLRVPKTRVEPGRGDTHRRRCLESLALFGTEPG